MLNIEGVICNIDDLRDVADRHKNARGCIKKQKDFESDNFKKWHNSHVVPTIAAHSAMQELKEEQL